MNKLSIVIFLGAVSMAGVSCKSKKGNENQQVLETNTSQVNVVPVVEEVKLSYDRNPVSIEFEDMDPSVDPKKDFYSYANGTWVKNNPVPSTENRWSSFNILAENNNAKLRDILEKCAAKNNTKGTIHQLIGDYYFTYMDSAKRDAEGIAPIKTDLKKIDQIKNKKELTGFISNYHNYGITPLFGMSIDQDLMDVNLHITYVSQGGLLLPNRDYYFDTTARGKDLLAKYNAHLTKMFGFIGYDEKRSAAAAASVISLETKLAEKSMGPIELRDIQSQYNKQTVEDLKKTVPSFDWNAYFAQRGIKDVKDVVVGQPLFFARMEEVIKSESLDTWKDYLKIHFFEATGSKLSSQIDAEIFSFFSTTLRGTKKMKKRWERAITAVSWSSLGEALGHAFVDEHFKPESKQKVNEMVDNIMAVFRERLDQLDWMSDETKKRALIKLGSFTRKLGYPDKWTDYSTMNITRESYFKNWMETSRFAVKQNIDKLGKPIDRGEWQMAPHIVNAYYNPLWNEIVFPAGIMQPPFFDPTKEDAVNYARMGAVIGHEFLHGFDDQGAQFDETGAFKNWWTSTDSTKFAARTKRLVDQFNSFEALPGLFVQGELTLGENIADLGGLTMAYYAYQRSLNGKTKEKINGFTPEQRFFIAFAQVWKENHTDNSMMLQVKTNPHAPGKFRVLGPLSNMPEFFSAFNVKEGDQMRNPEDKIVRIW